MKMEILCKIVKNPNCYEIDSKRKPAAVREVEILGY
jgi:hypothetical protein